MSERMTEERLAEIREAVGDDWHWAFVEGEGFCHFPDGVTPEYANDEYPSAKAFNAIPDLLAEIDALRAELAEARLAAAVADGTATPEMLRDAGVLEGWTWEDVNSVWFLKGVDDAVAWNGEWRVVYDHGDEGSTLANLRAADAAVRKLLAEGEAAG